MAVLAAVFAVPTAANAAWDETTTYAYNGGAWTNAIPSHSTQHWVRYMVQPSGFFEVYDRDSGAIVARGSGDGHWHTVYGLYNQHYAYQLHVWVIGNSGNYSRAWLDNCTSGCRNQGVWRPV